MKSFIRRITCTGILLVFILCDSTVSSGVTVLPSWQWISNTFLIKNIAVILGALWKGTSEWICSRVPWQYPLQIYDRILCTHINYTKFTNLNYLYSVLIAYPASNFIMSFAKTQKSILNCQGGAKSINQAWVELIVCHPLKDFTRSMMWSIMRPQYMEFIHCVNGTHNALSPYIVWIVNSRR